MAQTGNGFLSFDKCQKLVETACDLVTGYAKNIEKKYNSEIFVDPVKKLDSVKQQILKADSPFLTGDEIGSAIRPILLAFFSRNSKITNQLKQFWNAQLELSDAAAINSSQPTCDPLKLANENMPKILKADEIYQKVVKSVNSNPTEDSLIYAIFYNLITLVETAEFAFRKNFEDLLTTYNLNSKYDAKKIFSIDGKVPMYSEFRTDGRAIRDALGHFKFDIKKIDGDTEIKFEYTEDGYNFKRVFKKIDFLEFVQNTYLLYKTQGFLVWLFIASATMNSAFKKKDPKNS